VFSGGSEIYKLDEKWDYTAAWAYLENNRSYLEELAEKHGVDVYDLCLGEKLSGTKMLPGFLQKPRISSILLFKKPSLYRPHPQMR
jgi:hypothetical protein